VPFVLGRSAAFKTLPFVPHYTSNYFGKVDDGFHKMMGDWCGINFLLLSV